jgi:precorrin-6B methylase 1
MQQQNGKTGVTVPAGATRTELEDIQKDLEKQRDDRMSVLLSGDPTLREITGALKGIGFALDGPPETDDSGN